MRDGVNWVAAARLSRKGAISNACPRCYLVRVVCAMGSESQTRGHRDLFKTTGGFCRLPLEYGRDFFDLLAFVQVEVFPLHEISAWPSNVSNGVVAETTVGSSWLPGRKV